MNKLLAILIGSLFAVTTAFAASHVGAPMAAASGAKPAASAAKADKKAVKKTKKTKKTDKAVMKEEKKS